MIDPFNGTGNPVVSFRGVDGGTLTTPTPTERGKFSFPVPDGHGTDVRLGEFVVTLPTTGTTEFKSTPFTITFKVDSVDGQAPGAETKDMVLQGFLSGFVNGSGDSNLRAIFGVMDIGEGYFPRFSAGGFITDGLVHGMTIPDYTVQIAPANSRNGVTPVSGVLVSAESVAEPSTMAAFVAVAGFLWGRSRWKRA
ncbi:hypothetical protein [Aquisphaera insulae]|uniref:hypothetical protein n=1 Tax=Aquisphaera insulae TaxID=2712864 RepID=UPI0013EA9227|nr:hypothetical protein [Aquisphaera insulae]